MSKSGSDSSRVFLISGFIQMLLRQFFAVFVVCSQPAIANAVDVQCVGPPGKTFCCTLALLKCLV